MIRLRSPNGIEAGIIMHLCTHNILGCKRHIIIKHHKHPRMFICANALSIDLLFHFEHARNIDTFPRSTCFPDTICFRYVRRLKGKFLRVWLRLSMKKKFEVSPQKHRRTCKHALNRSIVLFHSPAKGKPRCRLRKLCVFRCIRYSSCLSLLLSIVSRVL